MSEVMYDKILGRLRERGGSGVIDDSTVAANKTWSSQKIKKIEDQAQVDGIALSVAGMTPDSKAAAASNGQILDTLLAAKKNIIVDGTYYIDGDADASGTIAHTVDYPIVMTGVNGCLIWDDDIPNPQWSAVRACINIVEGGSLDVRNIKFVTKNTTVRCHFFYCKMEKPFVVKKVLFDGCEFQGGNTLYFWADDLDFAEEAYGINTVRITNCSSYNNDVFNKYTSGMPVCCFSFSDMPVLQSFFVGGNMYMHSNGAFVARGQNNNYTNKESYIFDECEFVVSGNIFDNTGYIADSERYIALALIEALNVRFTGNVIRNVISLSSASGATYDAYMNCNRYIYSDNDCHNIANFVTDKSQGNAAFVYSKALVTNSVSSERIITNSRFVNDYDEIRKMLSDYSETTYTDKEWEDAIGKVKINGAQYNEDYRLIRGCTFVLTDGILSPCGTNGSYPSQLIEGNTFKVGGFDNGFATFSSGGESLIIRDNIFDVTGEMALMRGASAITVNNPVSEIVIKGNTFVNGYINTYYSGNIYAQKVDIDGIMKHKSGVNIRLVDGLEKTSVMNYVVDNGNIFTNYTNNGLSRVVFQSVPYNTTSSLRIYSGATDSYVKMVRIAIPSISYERTMFLQCENGDMSLLDENGNLISVLSSTAYNLLGTNNASKQYYAIYLYFTVSGENTNARISVAYYNNNTPADQVIIEVIPTDMVSVATRTKGTTAQMPTLSAMDSGRLYYDTTKGQWCWWNGEEWVYVSPAVQVASTAPQGGMLHNTIYNCGELAALTITLPSTIDVDYISQINFTSGSTATQLTAPATIVWDGDSIDTNGLFVPETNMRYTVMLYSDGSNVLGIVRGTAIHKNQSNNE